MEHQLLVLCIVGIPRQTCGTGTIMVLVLHMYRTTIDCVVSTRTGVRGVHVRPSFAARLSARLVVVIRAV
jgi:hypothetical protein